MLMMGCTRGFSSTTSAGAAAAASSGIAGLLLGLLLGGVQISLSRQARGLLGDLARLGGEPLVLGGPRRLGDGLRMGARGLGGRGRGVERVGQLVGELGLHVGEVRVLGLLGVGERLGEGGVLLELLLLALLAVRLPSRVLLLALGEREGPAGDGDAADPPADGDAEAGEGGVGGDDERAAGDGEHQEDRADVGERAPQGLAQRRADGAAGRIGEHVALADEEVGEHRAGDREGDEPADLAEAVAAVAAHEERERRVEERDGDEVGAQAGQAEEDDAQAVAERPDEVLDALRQRVLAVEGPQRAEDADGADEGEDGEDVAQKPAAGSLAALGRRRRLGGDVAATAADDFLPRQDPLLLARCRPVLRHGAHPPEAPRATG